MGKQSRQCSSVQEKATHWQSAVIFLCSEYKVCEHAAPTAQAFRCLTFWTLSGSGDDSDQLCGFYLIGVLLTLWPEHTSLSVTLQLASLLELGSCWTCSHTFFMGFTPLCGLPVTKKKKKSAQWIHRSSSVVHIPGIFYTTSMDIIKMFAMRTDLLTCHFVCLKSINLK